MTVVETRAMPGLRRTSSPGRLTSHPDSAPGRSWTAPPSASATPLTSPPPPPPPPAPNGARPVPSTAVGALDEMTEVIAGARGALLASVDGFALAQSETMPNEASHAAMLAAALGLAQQLASMGGGEQLRQLVVDHDNGLLLVWPIGAGRVLAMLTDSGVDQARLRRFVRSRASLLADAT